MKLFELVLCILYMHVSSIACYGIKDVGFDGYYYYKSVLFVFFLIMTALVFSSAVEMGVREIAAFKSKWSSLLYPVHLSSLLLLGFCIYNYWLFFGASEVTPDLYVFIVGFFDLSYMLDYDQDFYAILNEAFFEGALASAICLCVIVIWRSRVLFMLSNGFSHLFLVKFVVVVIPYILIGVVFSALWLGLSSVSPESLSRVLSNEFDSIYFSFVTLTTLGYGDVSPIGVGAQMLAVIEAVIGVFYMSVVVAIIVSASIEAKRVENKTEEQLRMKGIKYENVTESKKEP